MKKVIFIIFIMVSFNVYSGFFDENCMEEGAVASYLARYRELDYSMNDAVKRVKQVRPDLIAKVGSGFPESIVMNIYERRMSEESAGEAYKDHCYKHWADKNGY